MVKGGCKWTKRCVCIWERKGWSIKIPCDKLGNVNTKSCQFWEGVSASSALIEGKLGVNKKKEKYSYLVIMHVVPHEPNMALKAFMLLLL